MNELEQKLIEAQKEIHRLNDIIRRMRVIGGWDLYNAAVMDREKQRECEIAVYGK
jgi:hypothetical protein